MIDSSGSTLSEDVPQLLAAMKGNPGAAAHDLHKSVQLAGIVPTAPVNTNNVAVDDSLASGDIFHAGEG